jgi:hypothetical protein
MGILIYMLIIYVIIQILSDIIIYYILLPKIVNVINMLV